MLTPADLADYGVDRLWYLTHVDNIRSILAHGILSYKQILQLGLQHERIDWAGVQRHREKEIVVGKHRINLHDVVPMFFSTHQPMLYVQQSQFAIAHLEIDPAVVATAGTVFSDGNAASNETRFFADARDLAELDWHVIRTDNCFSRNYKRKKAAEVLAASPVEARYIRRIHFDDVDLVATIQPFCGRDKAVYSPHLYRC